MSGTASRQQELSQQQRQRSTTFLLGIFSMHNETQHRQLTRSTMLGKDLPESVRSRLCSLQDYLGQSSTVATNNNNKYNQCQIIYTFVIGGGGASAPNEYPDDVPLSQLTVAQSNIRSQDGGTESDLVMLNIQENMSKGKTPSWFHYASTIVPEIDYVSKIDLDTLVSIPQLLNFITTELPPRPQQSSSNTVSHNAVPQPLSSLLPLPTPPRVYGGLLMDYEACGGEFFPSRCFPAKHKPYMSGQFYFISYDILQYQSEFRTNRTFKERKYEDLAFGVRVWGYPHPIKVMALNPNYFWKHNLKTKEQWMEAYEELKAKDWKIKQRYFVSDVFKQDFPIIK